MLIQIGKLKATSSSVTDKDGIKICRLFIQDKTSNCKYLIDTGADISVFPATNKQKLCKPHSLELQAANNTTIKTFGLITLELSLGLRKSFVWKFIIADVSKPIIGADFLGHFGLLVDIKNSRIIDKTTNLSSIGSIDISTSEEIHYARMKQKARQFTANLVAYHQKN